MSGDGEALPGYLTSPRAFITRYIVGWRGHFAALAAMVLGATSCAVGVQYMMKLMIDAMAAGPTPGLGAVWTALFAFIGLIAAESVLWRLSGWIGCRTTIAVGVAMRLDLFDHLSGHAMRYFTENRAGSLGQRITATAGNFGALANTVVWRIAPPTVDFVGAVVVFTLIDWHMAVALGLFVAIVTTGLVLLGRRGRPLHRAYARQSGETAGELTDVISNMWAVKAFAARRRERVRLADRFGTEAEAQRASWLFTERMRVLYDVVLWTMAAGMLSWALFRWHEGHITTGDVVIVSALTFRILHGARDVVLALVDLAQQLGYIEETLSVIGRRPSLVDDPRHLPLAPSAGRIEFRGVSFSYGDARDAIHEFDLVIPGGQKVGIVGPSGAGKSTLVALIQRLWDVQSGEILIDGQSVRAVTQDSLRQALAVVPQEITLFHRSVAENIRFGRPGASDEDVRAAARAAYCDGFIRALPQGYDTIVGERGTKLSGGQRQRIGIARAFLKDAPIIILDEATSALDTESEMEVQRGLIELMAGRTVIAVAHRLSTVLAFDRVVVMGGGRVLEDDHAAALKNRGGHFERMWRLQSEGLAAARELEPARDDAA